MEEAVGERQRELVSEWAARRHRFMDEKELRAVDPLSSPDTPRAKGDFAPALAAAGRRERLELAKQALREFRAAYRDAYELYRRGEAAVFPFGTYLMAKWHRVQCESDPGLPWCAAAG